MNEIAFVFFGEPEEIDSFLLRKLNILDFRNRTAEKSGLYAIEKKYGKEVTRKINIDFLSDDEGDWLFYRYTSREELKRIQENKSLRRIYILCHNFLNFEYIKTNIVAHCDEGHLHYIVDENRDEFKSSARINKLVETKRILQLQRPRQSTKGAALQVESGAWRLPPLVSIILKLLLNPLNELNRYSILLKYSNMRILKRGVELGLFLIYVSRFVLNSIYWNVRFVGGVFKVVAIKFGFFVRHILLMMGFKSFGVFVDSYEAVKRFFTLVIQFFYYKSLHRFYHRVMRRLIDLVKIAGIRIGFILRHVLLMLGFKSFGAVVDFYQALRRWFSKILDVFYYKSIHRLYHGYIKKVITVLIFEIILQFYYKVVLKTMTFIWENILSVILFDVLLQFYHKIAKPLFVFLWVRVLSVLIFDVFVQFFHKVVRKVFSFLWVKVFSILIYDVIIKSYYVGTGWLKRHVIIGIYNFVVYDIRHFALMAYYKLYGMFFDALLFSYRITKLYMLYPVRKMYWFFDFQYRKRIKKQI